MLESLKLCLSFIILIKWIAKLPKGCLGLGSKKVKEKQKSK